MALVAESLPFNPYRFIAPDICLPALAAEGHLGVNQQMEGGRGRVGLRHSLHFKSEKTTVLSLFLPPSHPTEKFCFVFVLWSHSC